MTEQKVDFENISKDDIMRIWETWGNQQGKWLRFAEEFIASKKPAVEIKNIHHSNISGTFKNKFPNLVTFSRKNRIFICNLDYLPTLKEKLNNK